MAIESQGTLVFWSTTTSMSTAQAVSEVTSVGGPNISAGKIDVTHLASTAKENIIGLRDSGDVTLDMIYNSTDAGQLALRNDLATRSKRRLAIKLVDASTTLWHAEGFCTNWSVSGSVDNTLKLSATIGLTGPITWTTN